MTMTMMMMMMMMMMMPVTPPIISDGRVFPCDVQTKLLQMSIWLAILSHLVDFIWFFMGGCQCSVDLSVQLTTCVFRNLFNCLVVWANKNVCHSLVPVFLRTETPLAPPIGAAALQHDESIMDFLANVIIIRRRTVILSSNLYSPKI